MVVSCRLSSCGQKEKAQAAGRDRIPFPTGTPFLQSSSVSHNVRRSSCRRSLRHTLGGRDLYVLCLPAVEWRRPNLARLNLIRPCTACRPSSSRSTCRELEEGMEHASR